MGNKIIVFLIAHVHPYGYSFLLLITTMETSVFLGLFVPGDTVAILIGFFASREIMKLHAPDF